VDLEVQERSMSKELWDGTRAGVKDDQGKPQPFKGFINYFPRTILAVSEVSVFGSKKYSWGGFNSIENGNDRYQEGQWRHLLKQCIDGQESLDDESKLLHMMHEAWCAMAKVEMYLIDKEKQSKESTIDDQC
jgi:hypothetical protein